MMKMPFKTQVILQKIRVKTPIDIISPQFGKWSQQLDLANTTPKQLSSYPRTQMCGSWQKHSQSAKLRQISSQRLQALTQSQAAG